ncbi:branched-chain amino acid ABC transporter permease [Cryobacterium sp. Y11]|uniref:branched-chain amino acid ABC transporter permease n=1 Tax=Cryobacterium sp. Y11 TaxID=2045016 RepID=UPI000CE3E582|nr:branched-chain amino acid ABC transporter permease [Cryobacterium sp. Y11]
MLRKLIPLTVVIVCFSLVPLVTDNNFFQNLVITVLIFATFATAWNIVGGLTGLFSLGHGALFAIGAYGAVLLNRQVEIPVLLAIPLAGLGAVLVALLLGLISLRLSGHYFALATLAFGAIGVVLLSNFSAVTGGDEGISIPFTTDPWGLVFEGTLPYLYLNLGVYVVTVLIVIALVRSKWGFRMRAIREDETTARSMGVPIFRTKMFAVSLSGFLSSIAGSMFAYYTLYITPANTASVNSSLEPALMSIIGGMGGIFGPLVGAILITLLEQQIITVIGAVIPGFANFIYGALLILCIILAPKGLLGFIDRFKPKKRKAKPTQNDDAPTNEKELESA